ncbi:MAG TPA: hypothetical protein VGL42_07440 [Opitutaceae bacterium]|jgi:flagellar motor protein MotB
MFLICPVVMLAVFLVFYIQSQNRLEAAEHARNEAKARQDAADDARKSEAEANARKAAAERRIQTQKEDADKEAARLAKYQAQLDEVLNKEKTYRDEANARSNEASDLEVKLDSLHHERDELNQHYFDTLKSLELTRIKERDAELDIQRMVTRITQRAENSQMIQMPALPPTER